MRHGLGLRKLNRTSSHRLAMLRNMTNSLLKHEAIKTTLPKAKELRRVVEPMITLGKTPTLANKRLAFDRLRDREIVVKLFGELGPRFKARPGGYTRILKVGFRRGDGAETALIELVGSEYVPSAPAESEGGEDAPKKTKGVGERIRQAARRIRGGGQDKKAQAKSQTTGGRKTTTPRKAGGS